MFCMLLLSIACESSSTDTVILNDTGEETIEQMHIEGSFSLDTSNWSVELARTKENPLKGFLTSYLWGEPASNFPDSMEYLYIPMKDIWNENGETFDSGLEPLLERAKERNHHVVMRIFIDYPSQESALPEYLEENVSCEPYSDHGGGCSPDYTNPILQEAILDLIQKLGERYNGDKRIGFIQAGFLGFWGEWHTWPHPEWFASEQFQQEVIDTYLGSFSDTFVQLRYPTTESAQRNLGYHDDSFAYSTLGEIDWFFYPKLIQAGAENKWLEVPIGGELRPELQPDIFSSTYEQDVYAQDIVQCIEQVHPTYMLNYWAFNGEGDGYQENERIQAEQASMLMGYQFEIRSAELIATQSSIDRIFADIKITLAQTGVAPFYYPLHAQLITKDRAFSFPSTVDLSTLIPGETIEINFSVEDAPIEIFQQKFFIELHGDILLNGQQIMMPTTTDTTDFSEPTSLFWDIQCQHGYNSIPLGSSIFDTATETDCYCSLDNQLYTQNGTPCTGVP